MKEDSPAGSSDQKLNRDAGAMRAKLIARLPAHHGIHVTAAIELRPALTQSEQKTAGRVEFQRACPLIKQRVPVRFPSPICE